jgi:hypothetical protein
MTKFMEHNQLGKAMVHKNRRRSIEEKVADKSCWTCVSWRAINETKNKQTSWVLVSKRSLLTEGQPRPSN